MPSISVEGEVSALAADPETVEILEQSVISWLNQISAAVEGQLKKTPQVTCACFRASLMQLTLASLRKSQASAPCVVQPLFVLLRDLLKRSI